jgi:hypothetical protein
MGLKWTRKLQRVSDYSVYVALPKIWIINNDLEGAGKEVRIEMQKDGSLTITPEGRP